MRIDSRTYTLALALAASLLLGGCFTNHFSRDPTPANFVADGVNNTVTAAAYIPLIALAVPVLAVHEITDAVATEPCRCDESACGEPCRRCACRPRPTECTPPPCRTLPATWYPGWEEDAGAQRSCR